MTGDKTILYTFLMQ